MFKSPKSLIALYSAHKEVKKNRLHISLQQSLIQKTANIEVDEIFKYFKKF